MRVGEEQAHLVVRADGEQSLDDVVGEGVVQQGAEVGGELLRVRVRVRVRDRVRNRVRVRVRVRLGLGFG